MIIKSVKLKDFRNFEGEHTFYFDKLNLIVGKIGSGKSTIGRISVAFALYGDSEVSLNTLPTRGKEKTCTVQLEIEDKGNQILITRSYPTKVEITVDGVKLLDGSTNVEKDKWIINRFNDLNYFKKFRMIDLKQGINLLEEGPTGLKKTLVSFHEDLLNKVRQRLQDKKNLYDKYNKDRVVVYKHYPSEKRLMVLEEAAHRFLEDNEAIINERKRLEDEHNKISRESGSKAYQINSYQKTLQELRFNKECSLCKSKLPEHIHSNLIQETRNKLEMAIMEADELKIRIDDIINNIFSIDREFRDKQSYYQGILHYKQRLETRLKQIDYKYTNNDVLLMANAIKHLDKFYSIFILQHVKNLCPIINSITSKINFTVDFKLDEKQNFSLTLIKDGKEFSYKDLSSGQRLILTIAFQIALLLEKGDTGVIVADEGFSNLDEESITVLYELFKELPFQVISIIHRFDNIPSDVKLIRLGDTNVRQN